MSDIDEYLTKRQILSMLDANGAVQGREGPKGKDGQDGRDGEKGEKGSQGQEGKQGCEGPRGNDGRIGERGLDGKDGCDGRDGKDGNDGREGREGPIGKTGQKGQDGRDGKDGCDGREGPMGQEGPEGRKGEPGEKGQQGTEGKQGVKGNTGESGPPGEPGEKGEKGEKGDKGDTGETGPTGAPGQDGQAGSSGGNGQDGQDGADGFSPTLTKVGFGGDGTEASPYTSINFSVTDANGTSDCFLSTSGTGGSGCCNTGFTGPVINEDGTSTYTLEQTNGDSIPLTLPAGGDGTGGLDKVAVQACVDATLAALQTRCVTTATGFTMNLVDAEGNVVVPAEAECAWPVTGTGNVTCVTGVDPENPCFDRAILTVDGVECALELYNPECCTCVCVTVVAGQTVVFTGTTTNGAEVNWEDNNTVTDIPAGANQTAEYTFPTAGEYKITICLNDPCDTLTDWNITGATSVKYNSCK